MKKLLNIEKNDLLNSDETNWMINVLNVFEFLGVSCQATNALTLFIVI